MLRSRSVHFVWMLFGVALAWHPAAGWSDRPNVLLILADDLGYSDIGCYGGEIETPNLDRLAEHGARFTQFYNSGRCWPTRGALMTGYYAQQVRRDALPGVPGGGHGQRPPWAPLLSRLLKQQGYRTYHSGKWHIDRTPINCGFDHSYWLEDYDRFFEPANHFLDDRQLGKFKATDNYYSTSYIADHAIKCLREHAGNHADRPFFSYVAFTSPHFPLQAPAEDVEKYRAKYDAGWDALRQQRFARIRSLLQIPAELSPLEPDVGPPYHFANAYQVLGSDEVNREFSWADLSESQRQFQSRKMEIHAAMVDRLDQEVGRMIEQIDAMGASEETLIVFLSDNGASAEIMVRGDGHNHQVRMGGSGSYLCLGPGFSRAANTPFRRHKTWVHEGGIATPLIVSWPGKMSSSGGLRHQVGHVIDLVPTLMDCLGVDSSAGAEMEVPPRPGRSLMPAILDDQPVQRDYLWWFHEGNRALRVGDWKLVAARDEPWELYDLARDRSECRDLSREQAERLEQMIETWESHTNATRESLLRPRNASKS